MQAAALCADWPGRAGLDWNGLVAWPDWALRGTAAEADQLALRAGARRDAARLRACIDGGVLQAAAALLGEDTFGALLIDAAGEAGDAGALPPANQLGSAWREAGRGVLLDGIADAALRAAVADRLGWAP